MKQTNLLVTVALMSACAMETEGIGSGTSESSTGSTVDTQDPDESEGPITDDGPELTSTGSSTTGGGSETPGSDGDELTSSEEGSSTGEPSTDFGLFFDGSASVTATDISGFTAAEFTVEAWIEIVSEGEATGVIIDNRRWSDLSKSYTHGMVLYIEPDTQRLLCGFIGDDTWNYVLGPTVPQFGVGWHHVAATKSDANLFLFVDGVSEGVEVVDVSVAQDVTAMFHVGDQPESDGSLRLRQITLDDVRVVDFPLYESNFDPPVVYDDEGEASTLVHLKLDENAGVVTTDEYGMVFMVDGAQWTAGHE